MISLLPFFRKIWVYHPSQELREINDEFISYLNYSQSQLHHHYATLLRHHYAMQLTSEREHGQECVDVQGCRGEIPRKDTVEEIEHHRGRTVLGNLERKRSTIISEYIKDQSSNYRD